MDKYKKFILRVVLVSIVLFGFYGTIAYIRDPLMLLHKPYFEKIGYDDNLRISNASVIHNVDFDSIIVFPPIIIYNENLHNYYNTNLID